MKNKLLYFLISLLGFATACDKDKENEPLVMYGPPPVKTHTVQGKVTDTAGRPIKGIQVVISNPDWFITTAENGSYIVSNNFKQETARLVFNDIDGPANGGEFQQKTLDVTFTEADRKDGVFVKTGIDIQLTEKE